MTLNAIKDRLDNRYLNINNNDDADAESNLSIRKKMLRYDIAELMLCDQLRREQCRGW